MPAGSITLQERLRAAYSKTLGLKRWRFAKDGWDGDYQLRFLNAAKTDVLPLLGSDALNNRLVDGQIFEGNLTPIEFRISAAAKISLINPFFVNCNDTTPLEIRRIDCVFATADGAVNTGFVSKEIQGQTAGGGATCMSGTFDMNATANTLQTATLAGITGWPSLVLNPGEQLTFNIASALTSLAGLVVTVWVRPQTGISIAQYVRVANADIATGTMYLNIIPGLQIRAVAIRWDVAATNGGTVTADVTKDTGTTAPGAGTSVLAAAQSVKGTADTTVFPALSATASVLLMAAGDRLAVKLTGTLTALTGLVVTVFFTGGPMQSIIVPISFWDAQATDRVMYTSRGYYKVTDYWGTWSVASTSNKQLLTRDQGTTAPGAGTGLLSDNTNAGIDTSTTANTPVEGTLVTNKNSLRLAPGDRLGIKNAGTTGALAGDFAVVMLEKL